MVDVYTVANGFMRAKFVDLGLPQDRVIEKPNFIRIDPGVGDGASSVFLFVGRWNFEKGISTLLDAWRHVGGRARLIIAGDGPMRDCVVHRASLLPNVEVLGWQSHEDILSLMKRSSALIVPSLWYEGSPLVIIEAYATSLPVIASDVGSLSGLIRDFETGLHFQPGDSLDLASKIDWFLSQGPRVLAMRREARAEYEAKYNAEANYVRLIKIYERARCRK
ncbi:MAG: glycosyltransferase family 4 protein [Bryobacteraceae bacterium]|nr:glycosyltransferase family 4 protein [Bryobacteraceae bacterium]